MKKHLFLLLPFLTACTAMPFDTNATHPVWQSARVENIVGEKFTAAQLAQSEFGLLDKDHNNDIRGYAYMGCNRIGFQTVFDGAHKVRFENAYATRMACHDSGLEDAFLRLIGEIDNYREEGGRLILRKADQPLIILVPRAQP